MAFGDAGRNLAEIGLRIDAVEFGRLDDGVQGGGSLATGFRIAKETLR
jgi:hypothetical protein